VTNGSSSIAAALRTSPPRPRCRQSCHRALTDEIPLKLCECTEDVKDESSACIGGVDVLGQRLEPHTTCIKRVDDLDQVQQRTTEPIQSPNHQGVALPQRLQTPTELNPIHVLAKRFFLEDLLACGSG